MELAHKDRAEASRSCCVTAKILGPQKKKIKYSASLNFVLPSHSSVVLHVGEGD